ncbi:MAG: lamin tail domain-containing protein [Planctomycetota bacterium]|jgi:hypothetical protein
MKQLNFINLVAFIGMFTFVYNPSTAQIVIDEIMQNPAVVSDNVGEWFELYNPTENAVDLEGWTIRDNDYDSHVINNGGPLPVPAGGYLVLGRNGNPATNGGVSVDYVYSGINLHNKNDELLLLDGTLTEIDRVEWYDGSNFPEPNGATMTLKDPALDNNIGINWCESSIAFGAGDFGTPGADNIRSCYQPGDYNNDGDVDQDDFIEFELCASGPAIPHNGSTTCLKADFDDDNDVDQNDFAIFQICYSGQDILADPRCDG